MKLKIPKLNHLQIILLTIVVLLMAIGILLIVIALKPAKTTTTNPKQVPIAVIEINNSGFVPSTIQVKPGTKVVWVNKDVAPHQIAADPYPTHETLPALVAPKAMGQNQTYSFVFTKTRTVNYHDELNPTWGGTITVAK
jgi:plastocyanin